MLSLKSQRRKQNMTQSRLEQLSGVNRVTISNIESDKTNPTIGTIEKLAKALGCNVSDLLATDQTKDAKVE